MLKKIGRRIKLKIEKGRLKSAKRKSFLALGESIKIDFEKGISQSQMVGSQIMQAIEALETKTQSGGQVEKAERIGGMALEDTEKLVAKMKMYIRLGRELNRLSPQDQEESEGSVQTLKSTWTLIKARLNELNQLKEKQRN